MNIIVTGSLGHISLPLATTLVQQGHKVTVISSDPGKQAAIEALGANAAIGSLEDIAFLKTAFTGADAVYTMVPPNNYFDHNLDLLTYYRRLGNNYAQAIEASGIKRVVNLSTIGADLEKGSGILLGAHDVAEILDGLPAEVTVIHMRPTSFYYNLYGYVDMIKTLGFIAANYGEDDIVPWVAPVDIADAVAAELTASFTGRKFRYVVSEERSCRETAGILGAAIGMPELEWKIISDEEMLNGLKTAGMAPHIAAGLVEMYAGLHSGILAEAYYRNKPEVMGKVKVADFAKEFATAFNQN